jgi:hypothetical protein
MKPLQSSAMASFIATAQGRSASLGYSFSIIVF